MQPRVVVQWRVTEESLQIYRVRIRSACTAIDEVIDIGTTSKHRVGGRARVANSYRLENPRATVQTPHPLPAAEAPGDFQRYHRATVDAEFGKRYTLSVQVVSGRRRARSSCTTAAQVVYVERRPLRPCLLLRPGDGRCEVDWTPRPRQHVTVQRFSLAVVAEGSGGGRPDRDDWDRASGRRIAADVTSETLKGLRNGTRHVGGGASVTATASKRVHL